MEPTKQFLEKVFSTKRMERYFALYPDDEARAIRHYECNLMLAESLYVSLSAPLNTFRCFRNRIFHNESICWNLSRVEEIHAEMLKVIGWMNRDLPEWVEAQERFTAVCAEIRRRMEWE